jgi:hypothetical protein
MRAFQAINCLATITMALRDNRVTTRERESSLFVLSAFYQLISASDRLTSVTSAYTCVYLRLKALCLMNFPAPLPAW